MFQTLRTAGACNTLFLMIWEADYQTNIRAVNFEAVTFEKKDKGSDN